jgi:hypothetical protein
MQVLLRLLLRWFPERSFVFAGDSGFGSHDMASFVQAQAPRLRLVSRYYANANLYEPPPAVVGTRNGRPRKKGAKMPSPAQVVADAQRSRLRVNWYGGGQRSVEIVTGTGHWYKGGSELVSVRWVYVQDRTGTHRDDYLYSTDTTLTARQIMEIYTGRWNIETTFQEARSYLGLGSTRGWSRRTVLRAEPCLLGLYTVVAWLYHQLPRDLQENGPVVWLGKDTITFSDAITVVRRWLWQDWVLARPDHRDAFAKLPDPLKETLFYALAPAA